MGFDLQIYRAPKPGSEAQWRRILTYARREQRFESDEDAEIFDEIALPHNQLTCANPRFTQAELIAQFGINPEAIDFRQSRFRMCSDVAGEVAYDMWCVLLPEDAIMFGQKLIAAADAAERQPVGYSLRHLGTPINEEMIWTTRAMGAIAIYYGERGCALWVC